MKSINIKLLLLLAAMLILSGCSTVKVMETWKGSSLTSVKPFKKVLVVNINLDENVRKMYEDVVAAEMRDKGITAIPGHKYVKITKNYNRKDIQAAVEKTGADAVLITRYIDTGDQKVSQQGQGSVLYGEGYLPSSWDVMIATMQVNLYSTASEQLVWSARIKTSDADNKFHVSRDMGNLLTDLLKKDGLL